MPPPASLTPDIINQVATVKDLKDVAQKLDAQTEFAVDLEHHSYRTFQGFTCLMQISTRTGTRGVWCVCVPYVVCVCVCV
jgi:exosome complex exonuclease RRP6